MKRGSIMNFPQKYLASCLLMITALLCSSSPGGAQTAPNLGAAAAFEVLAGTAVTCTNSTVNGDAGAGIVVTETECTITGDTVDGAATDQAIIDFTAAFTALAGETCDSTLGASDLTDETITPGIYCVNAAGATPPTGTLTLDAEGDPNAVFIFLVEGAFTGTGFNVVTTNGADPCNVYWQVDAAATLTGSNFMGTILAGAAITMTNTLHTGNAYAGAAVTLTDSIVTGCVPDDVPPPDPDECPPPDPDECKDDNGDKDHPECKDDNGDKDHPECKDDD
jgi:hypothetical protein